MENGFFEFGFFALVAFVFVNVIWGLTLDAPPVRRKITGKIIGSDLKALETGISVDGTELRTPTFKKEVQVG